jgi:hypothetical protein
MNRKPETRWNHMLPPHVAKHAEAMGNPYYDVVSLLNLMESTYPKPSYCIEIHQSLASDTSPYACKSKHRENTFEIHLPRTSGDLPDFLKGFSPAEVLCHELGHIVARICEMPAAMKDYRVNLTLPKYSGELEGEEEAWDMAQEMMFGHFQTSRKIALNSYRVAALERQMIDGNAVLRFGFDTPEEIK